MSGCTYNCEVVGGGKKCVGNPKIWCLKLDDQLSDEQEVDE